MRALSTARTATRIRCTTCRPSLTLTATNTRPSSRPFASSTKPQTQTLYSFFPETLPDGPPPQGHFPINLRRLRSEFLRLQSQHHPDLHASSPASRPQAEATSAAINEAYKTLANPLLRAQYLLSLQGVDVATDETLKVEEPDLLMLVLEAHEVIEEAACAEDLEDLAGENEERIARSESVLEEARCTL
jgi:molecular chaperone HscB